MKQTQDLWSPRKSWSYIIQNGFAWCFSSKTSKCYHLTGLATLKKAIPGHDEELMDATKEINAILKQLAKNNSRKDVDLHLVDTPRGFLLAWANCEGVSGEDGPKAIKKELGLKK